VASGQGWYVFGVTGSDVTVPAGLDATPLAAAVEGLAAASIQAIVSRVAVDDLVGELPQDPTWLVPRVEAHDRVLIDIAALLPVVPFRFGVVHSSEERLVASLADRADRLKAALAQVGGCQEWTVVVEAGDGAAPSEAPPAAGPGRSYLLARHAALSARERVERAVAGIRQSCDAWEVPTALLPASPDDAERLACLVRRDRADDVRTQLESVAAGDVHVTVRGPLPPYHFVGHDMR